MCDRVTFLLGELALYRCFPKFLRFLPANNHSAIAPYSSLTAIPLTRQHMMTSLIISDPAFRLLQTKYVNILSCKTITTEYSCLTTGVTATWRHWQIPSMSSVSQSVSQGSMWSGWHCNRSFPNTRLSDGFLNNMPAFSFSISPREFWLEVPEMWNVVSYMTTTSDFP